MARRCADLDIPLNGKPTGTRRSDRFLAGLEDAPRVTFVSHVQPDPDSLGSMLGLAHLVECRLRVPTRLTRDGLINRAENRAMAELLRLDLVPVEELDFLPGEAVVMVDSQPNTGRHTFGDVPLYAVIDHHTTPGDLEDVPFVDVRPTLGATCTLVTRYLLEQDVPVPTRVATALMYGVETEVAGYPREATHMDDAALHFLFPLADKDILAQIRNARLPHSHFEVLLQALQSSFIYDRLIISWVANLPQPEQAAEVVDFMVRFEKVDWALCGGVCGDKLVLSLRTSLRGVQAGELLRQVVGKLGKAGGHDRRAGGTICLPSDSPTAVEEIQAELRRRFLKALRCEDARGQRLVPLREMLQNLQA
ncbi:MAG TPA: DHH family phosphoesterase [Gemmataceae bacterium]|nr:DHH family phosphoesterase [Gemmataceae bacterium]